MLNKLEDMLVEISEISTFFYQNRIEKAYQMLDKRFMDMNRIMMELIEKSPEYQRKGIEIPTDILISQIKNFIEAYEHKDSLMIADSLRYEIYEGISFYNEILRELAKGEA